MSILIVVVSLALLFDIINEFQDDANPVTKIVLAKVHFT